MFSLFELLKKEIEDLKEQYRHVVVYYTKYNDNSMFKKACSIDQSIRVRQDLADHLEEIIIEKHKKVEK